MDQRYIWRKEWLHKFPNVDGFCSRNTDEHRVTVIEVDPPDFVRFDPPPQLAHQIPAFRRKNPNDRPLQLTKKKANFLRSGCKVISFEIEAHATDLRIVGRNAQRPFLSKVVDDDLSHFYASLATF